MSLIHREDSITGIRLREAQQTKVATSAMLVDGSIVLDLPEGGVCTGTMVKFKAPCTCAEVTGGITIAGTTYVVIDSMHKIVSGLNGVWDVDAEVCVILDVDSKNAYLQNAATGHMLQDLYAHISDKNNPHDVHATQVPTSDECATMFDIVANNNVDEALKILWRLFNMLDLRFKGTNGEFTWNMYRQGTTIQGTASVTGNKSIHDYQSGIESASTKFSVSDTIEVVDGVIKLVNPTTFTVKTNDKGNFETSIRSVVGKYIRWNSASTVYKVLSSTSDDVVSGRHDSGNLYDWAEIVISGLGVVVVGNTFIGNVSSKDELAYPDKEWVGDIYYVKNNVELGLPIITEGTYTGMGSYGEASANGLTLPFVPEMLVIQSTTTNKSVTLLHGCTGIGGLVVTWNDSAKSVSWYHGSSAADQLNSSDEYRYFAIGKGVWS